jgi:DNA polymerase III subunit epsilon
VSLALAIVLLVVGIGLVASLLVRTYVLPLRRLARETRLMASANPAYRIDTFRPAPLRGLTIAINELAERSHTAQEDVEGRIAAARADLEQERNRLAALMSELTLAVLVCNADGRILLYNAAAGELFGGGERASGLVGLGRSIFGILDRGLFEHVLERIRHGGAEGGPTGVVRLTATATGGQLVRVAVAPIASSEGEPGGFVLTLEDVTRRAGIGARRDALLQSLTEGTRASVGAIRAAVESVLDYPDMDPAERQRFMTIIRDEAVGLGAHVEDAMRESAEHLRSEWRLAEILGPDLLAALQRRLEREPGIAVSAAEGGDGVWLKVDSYAVVEAVAHLAIRLRSHAAIGTLEVGLRQSGRHAQLDLAWDGRPLDPETLRAWTEEPHGGGGRDVASTTVKGVLERHGGEVWCQADPDGGRALLRVLLPLADDAHPVRRKPRGRRQPGTGSRPEFYDFDLFRSMPWGPEWNARRLDEVAYTVLDTETTGLHPSEGDEIISIGAVRIVNGRLLRQETFDQLVDPRRAVSPLSVSIHGISPDLLRGQPTIDEVLPLFARFCDDTVLVGHNVGFDMRFLELKEAQTGVRFGHPVLDVLLIDAVAEPEQEDHSLEAMAERLGVSVIGRHTALGDAILTGEIFLKQIRLLSDQGIATLAETRDAASGTYLARRSASLYSRA